MNYCKISNILDYKLFNAKNMNRSECPVSKNPMVKIVIHLNLFLT